MKKFLLLLVAAVAIAYWIKHDSGLLAKVPTTESVEAADASADALAKYLEVAIPSNTPSQMKEYEGFTISFNKKTHNPNYAAWVLTPERAAGTLPRSNNFWQDRTVTGCATLDDYKNSGFDRGHLAPAGDMKYSEKAMADCFSMANMTPQTPALNSGAWKNLEEKCRVKAIAQGPLIIVAGPVPERSLGKIGLTGVSIPRRFFKVILSPASNPPEAIGFIMPNKKFSGGMQAAAVSVDSVEAVTGYDFFSCLPDDVEANVEKQANFHRWSSTK